MMSRSSTINFTRWAAFSAVILTACVTPGEDDDNGASNTSAGSDDECQLGTEGCACVEGECFPGLECVDSQCVAMDTGDGDTESTDSDSESGTDSTEDESSEDSSEGDSGTTGGEEFGQDCPTGTMAGCEFFAVRLSIGTYQVIADWPTTLVFANLGETDVEVTVERNFLGEWMLVDESIAIGPLESGQLEIDGGAANIVSWGVDSDAYRIRSTGPVLAYAMTVDSASISALVPTGAWGQQYVVVAPGEGHHDTNSANYGVAIALADDTNVSVTLHDPIVPGNGIPSNTQAGDVLDFQLDAGQTLGLFSEGDSTATVVGHQIWADKPVAVFAGKQLLGLGEGHAADQLLPVSVWSTEHVGLWIDIQNPNYPKDRGWRVVAAEDSTFVSIEYDQADDFPMSPILLGGAGDHEDWEVFRGFLTSSAKPVALVPLVDIDQPGRTSMAVPPGMDRLLEQYVVWVPEGPDWADHRLITGSIEDLTVTIDGQSVQPLVTQPLTGDWTQRDYPLSPGVHVVAGSDPFVALVFGRTSSGNDHYLYSAGVDLN